MKGTDYLRAQLIEAGIRDQQIRAPARLLDDLHVDAKALISIMRDINHCAGICVSPWELAEAVTLGDVAGVIDRHLRWLQIWLVGSTSSLSRQQPR